MAIMFCVKDQSMVKVMATLISKYQMWSAQKKYYSILY